MDLIMESPSTPDLSKVDVVCDVIFPEAISIKTANGTGTTYT